jgi:predicted DNA-binding protein (MmcQ/YjbR family)
MNIDGVREFCLSFPKATEKLQWDDALCFKINGKLFAVLGLDDARLCFKCTPEMFAELIEREDIRPAPYVGRYKWVLLDDLQALPDDEMRALVTESFKMVAAKAQAPKKKQKVRVAAKRGKKRPGLARNPDPEA